MFSFIRERYWLRLSDELNTYLKNTLSPDRYKHSIRVARLSRALARRFNESPARAWFTGLSHDIAREWSDKVLLGWIAEHGHQLLADHQVKPILAHGHAGAWQLKKVYKVSNHQVLEAIRHHTLGDSGLDTLGLILFAADYLEPGRKFTSIAFRRYACRLELGPMVLACINHNAERGKSNSRLTEELSRHLSKKAQGAIVSLATELHKDSAT